MAIAMRWVVDVTTFVMAIAQTGDCCDGNCDGNYQIIVIGMTAWCGSRGALYNGQYKECDNNIAISEKIIIHPVKWLLLHQYPTTSPLLVLLFLFLLLLLLLLLYYLLLSLPLSTTILVFIPIPIHSLYGYDSLFVIIIIYYYYYYYHCTTYCLLVGGMFALINSCTLQDSKTSTN